MVQLLQSIEAISPHAEPILVISLTAILGLLLGSIRIRGMKLGVAGMLFSGLLLGHFGMSLDPQLMAFLKEFGLVLFVFTVGLQLGPGFVNSLKSDGLKLNSIAVMVVLGGALIAFGVGHFLKWDIGVTAGILSGGTTNTPSLGAAQQAMATASNDPQRLSAHHAVAHLGGADGGAMALLKTQVRKWSPSQTSLIGNGLWTGRVKGRSFPNGHFVQSVVSVAMEELPAVAVAEVAEIKLVDVAFRHGVEGKSLKGFVFYGGEILQPALRIREVFSLWWSSRWPDAVPIQADRDDRRIDSEAWRNRLRELVAEFAAFHEIGHQLFCSTGEFVEQITKPRFRHEQTPGKLIGFLFRRVFAPAIAFCPLGEIRQAGKIGCLREIPV